MIEALDFLLEIGTEELPPLSLKTLAENLQNLLQKNLRAANLTFGDTKYFATPRRLGVLVRKLSSKQEDVAQELKGPAVVAAFNADGTPTPACIGFARSCAVEISALQQKTFGKEIRLVVNTIKPGKFTKEILSAIVEQAIKELPVPKVMRWGDGNISFVRPVHSILMLYGNEVVKAVILGKESANKVHGHRFHHPDPLVINNIDDYEKLLETEGYVVPDFSKRSESIKQQIQDVCVDIGKVEISEDLLQEVTSIVEWPVALIGKFADKFLQLPKEVLELSLTKQQKCFPVFDADSKEKKIIPYFVTISNIDSKDKERVIRGNENVIRARLTDAEFFYKLDSEYPLETYFDNLKTTVFQTGLGSIFDKTTRLAHVVVLIAQNINANILQAKRAAELAKSDLMTTMVGEFPELQGIMGYYYELQHGESNEVALAIKEQYLPRFAGDILPTTNVGAVLAIADKIDTLVGNFCLKKIPTGEKDPFGLRRAVLGVLRIILEKNLDLNLESLIIDSINSYRKQCHEKVLEDFDTLILKNYQIPSSDLQENVEYIISRQIIPAILNFMFERLRGIFVGERMIATNVFNAVLANKPTRPLDFAKRIAAIIHFQTLPEAETLSVAQKRVKNILQKAQLDFVKMRIICDAKLLEHRAEKELFSALTEKRKLINSHYKNGEYSEVMTFLAQLKPEVDNFFDNVMVMVDDTKVRNNRLALLHELKELFNCVADISEL